MAETDDVTVFRAPSGRRGLAIAGMVVLALLAIRVVLAYGWLASIAAVFAILIAGQLWWQVLRPRLTADADGVEVVSGRHPERVGWADIQRTEVSPKGTLLVARGGREIFSKYPYGVRSASSAQADTEADRAATFLAARAAWGKRRTGPPPVYVPPKKP
jgi:hypothetical protein